jgi:cell division protein FtsI (penicillin-binding protein 3)
MQIMTAATAIANEGVLLKPLLIKKIVSPQGTVVKEFGREPQWEVISVESARAMLSWMESATLPGGTAHRAAIAGVRISAKTGTAQVADIRTGAYSDSDFIASMIGIFPTENPRLIIYVVAENPRGQSYYGSQIAAPIFHDVALSLMDKLGIPGAGAASLPPKADSASPKPGSSLEVGSIMPDLRGVPKKMLLPLLLRKDLVVTINGSGFVFSQDPPVGTRIQDGMKIDLELR